MRLTILASLLASVLLAACAPGGGRFVGFGNCSADGSAVWFEYPNAQGSYEGLNNSPSNCRR